MSQHQCQTRDSNGDALRIIAGWDRPLAYFYLTVIRDDADGSHTTVYSSAEDTNGMFAQVDSFAYYRDVLVKLGITLPVGMIPAIEQDGANNIGQRLVNWNTEARSA